MGVNSLPKTVTGEHRGCDLNLGPTAPESSALTTRLPSHIVNTFERSVLSGVVVKLLVGHGYSSK